MLARKSQCENHSVKITVRKQTRKQIAQNGESRNALLPSLEAARGENTRAALCSISLVAAGLFRHFLTIMGLGSAEAATTTTGTDSLGIINVETATH